MTHRVRRQRGIEVYASQFGIPESEVEEYFLSTFGPEFADEAFNASGGAAWDGPGLDDPTRSLIVIAILASLGGVESRLAGHARWALRRGVSADEIRSVMTLVANYAGFARASVALESISDVLDGPDEASGGAGS